MATAKMRKMIYEESKRKGIPPSQVIRTLERKTGSTPDEATYDGNRSVLKKMKKLLSK